VHWTLGILPPFSSSFLVSSFFCSQAETTSAQSMSAQTVGRWFFVDKLLKINKTERRKKHG